MARTPRFELGPSGWHPDRLPLSYVRLARAARVELAPLGWKPRTLPLRHARLHFSHQSPTLVMNLICVLAAILFGSRSRFVRKVFAGRMCCCSRVAPFMRERNVANIKEPRGRFRRRLPWVHMVNRQIKRCFDLAFAPKANIHPASLRQNKH